MLFPPIIFPEMIFTLVSAESPVPTAYTPIAPSPEIIWALLYVPVVIPSSPPFEDCT